MEIIYRAFARPDDAFFVDACEKYAQKIPHYIKFKYEIIDALKNTKSLSVEQQKQKEGEKILKSIRPGDYVILLDENGKTYTSPQFATFIQKQMNASLKKIVFISGGPYGFSKDVYATANGKISLSKMTFSHQMVQVFFLEQIYRAMTILKGEPYHH
ncbi:MAG: 23S rRNA (pseudouridine(1915)-N(3))-methyltransferase RlmH [Bacteroidales bacterium]|jgi:23S rRNA (pseudouridine1915-N3)-methyltransferase|nr:23S rRNA (pseudouridine(1915)-N(3))-methyltransferase RlmH [Bacteroidales bacterium]